MIPGSSLANRFPHQKAMIPQKLLWTRNVGILIYIDFITCMGMFQSHSALFRITRADSWIAMYAVFYFVDLYFALVLHYGSGKAGLNLLYYLPGLAGTSGTSSPSYHYLKPQPPKLPLLTGDNRRCLHSNVRM
jgi:hypothetical protein